MAKSKQSYNKREKEKSRIKKRDDKLKKKEERKGSGSGNFDDMIAWVDEFGNISDTPPDPNFKRTEVKAEDIQLGVPSRSSEDELDPVHEGIVTFFDTSKGYGFIRDKKTNESFFSHINDHLDEIAEGDEVSFSVIKGVKGMNAIEVKKISKMLK